LEPPQPGERPVTVSIDASVDAIIDDIIHQLRLNPVDSGAPRRKSS
jgi:gluconokinase